MRFCCKRCGSVDIEYRVKGTQEGIWCKDCGKWIKWLNKEEKLQFRNNKKTDEPKDYKIDIILLEILKELKEINHKL